jgi:membrane-bound lytic murein transglycosylase D
MYGLHQDWWYDGRRDVVASTDAALRYLDYLAGRFDGDWAHALASYNSGSGTVSKAIRLNRGKGKATNFWALKLPRETRAYVPKLIAIAKIVATPEKYGVTLQEIADLPTFAVVNAESQIDLAQAANLAGISLNELYLLNPGFNRWATPPLGPHKLAIPVPKAEAFRKGLAALPKAQRLNWQRYTVRRGDSLIGIAKNHHTTPDLIKDVNKLRSNAIRIGGTLLIPVAAKGQSEYSLSAGERLESMQSQQPSGQGLAKLDYIVRSGDTLWDIARDYKVNVRSLAKWNGFAPKDPLKPGQKLVIWTKLPVATTVATTAATTAAVIADNPLPSSRTMIRQINYKVRQGDSLARIADKFNVGINDIVRWNKINPKNYLRPGQKLVLHVDIAAGY